MDASQASTPSNRAVNWIAALFWCALIGGVTLTVAVFVDLPDLVVGVAATLFVSSVCGVFVISVRSASQAGTRTFEALALGAWAAVRWLVAFLP